jgi:hypothetical protein
MGRENKAPREQAHASAWDQVGSSRLLADGSRLFALRLAATAAPAGCDQSGALARIRTLTYTSRDVFAPRWQPEAPNDAPGPSND